MSKRYKYNRIKAKKWISRTKSMVKEPVFCVNCKLKSREDSNGLFYKDFCSRIHRHLDKRNLFTDQCEGKVKESEIDFEPNEYGECQYYKPKLIILLKKLIKKL